MYLDKNLNEQSTKSILDKEESHHSIRVLRQTVGDKVTVFNGKGVMADGVITVANKRAVEIDINQINFHEKHPYYLHVAIAPTKNNERIEWFLEKATEFGIDEISFFSSIHSERKTINIDRFKRIVLAAAKQSLSAYLPKLNDLVSFDSFIRQNHREETKQIATLVEGAQLIHPAALIKSNTVALIGPEGGFSSIEVSLANDYGFAPVLLGKKRLRTETAGIFYPSLFYQIHLNV